MKTEKTIPTYPIAAVLVVFPVITVILWVRFFMAFIYEGPAAAMALPYAPPVLGLMTWISAAMMVAGAGWSIRSGWRAIRKGRFASAAGRGGMLALAVMVGVGTLAVPFGPSGGLGPAPVCAQDEEQGGMNDEESGCSIILAGTACTACVDAARSIKGRRGIITTIVNCAECALELSGCLPESDPTCPRLGGGEAGWVALGEGPCDAPQN